MKIKKGWKITWITLGSLLGTVLLVTGVAIWMVFTPSQLTKLVNRLAGNFLTCEAHFEEVDLTLLSTFPDAGLKIKNVTLVKRMEDAPSDTLAFIGDMTLGIDLMAFLNHNELIVHQVYIDNAEANLYIDKQGRCNFDITPPSEDTTESEPLELIDLKKVEVKNLTARLKDEQSGTDAEVCGFSLTSHGRLKDSDIKGRIEAAIRRARLESKDSTGRQQMLAEVERLEIDADVDKGKLDIETKASLQGGKMTLRMADSTGAVSLAMLLDDFAMQLSGSGRLNGVEGKVALNVEDGTVDLGGQQMVNRALQNADAPLLKAVVPFRYSMLHKALTIDETSIEVADVGFVMAGVVDMQTPMEVDLSLRSKGAWDLSDLLSFIPDSYGSFRKGMVADGKVRLEVDAKGPLGEGQLPVVDATLRIDEGKYYNPSMLPYRIHGVAGNVTAHVDLSDKGVTRASLKDLRLATGGTRLWLTGSVDDLLGEASVDATVKGRLPLSDLAPVLPRNMKLKAEGDASLDMHASLALSDLSCKEFEKIKLDGTVKVQEADVRYDSLHALVPEMSVAIALPAQEHKDKLADVRITGGGEGLLKVGNGNWSVESQGDVFDINLGVNNLLREELAADYRVEIGETAALLDSIQLSTGGLTLKGSMRCDSFAEGFFARFNPRFGFSTHNTELFMSPMPEVVRLTDFEVEYKPEMCEIVSAQVMMGNSDFDLFGRVEGLEDWMAGNSMLRGYLNLTSEYSDVDQIMNLFSGMGSDPDSLEAMRLEDTVPAEAKPFIVPRNVDMTIHTHIKRSVALGNDLHDVEGELTVKDGVAVLDQMGFVCKAARMQLTAIYKSPRPNNLFTAIDFHLLDIQIDELLDMIPCMDTLVPMLKAFDGNANFHLAGETFLDARYWPKMSSLLGSAAISGENLVVMDNKDVARIAKLIGLKSWKDKDDKIRVDSLSVEMSCFRKEIEVYPFLLALGKYRFCLSGVHNLDGDCNYHIELLKTPLLAKVGVDVKGSLSDPKITLGEVRYGDFYKPDKKGAASKKALELKAMIRRELERNVR